jgi:hypothetical protein
MGSLPVLFKFEGGHQRVFGMASILSHTLLLRARCGAPGFVERGSSCKRLVLGGMGKIGSFVTAWRFASDQGG